MGRARAALALLLALLHHNRTVGVEDSLLDGMSIVGYQPLENVGADDYMNTHILDGGAGDSSLLFSPPKLTMGTCPLGVPHIQRVVVTNKLNRTVQLTSISGNSVDFHSSFFENKSIPPNGNTSFNVVFLGRIEGAVDGNLFIHTSEGIHKYVMSADGVRSEYRLPPLISMRLPYNATYAPIIYMHNPHSHRLQITEVFSSNPNIMLELPGGALEASQTMWSLSPHTTRPIIVVRYDNPPLLLNDLQPHPAPKDSQQPETSYVRIKFNEIPSMVASIMIVAVQIYAASEPGPYVLPPFIDFGMGGTRDSPKKVRLLMGNSSPRPVRISSINVETENGLPFGGLRVLTTAKTLLPPFSPPDIHIATLSLNWKSAYESGQCCGKVVIKTRQEHTIEVPFTSQPLNGGLIMNDESITRYLSTDTALTTTRQVLLKNTYKSSVYVVDLLVGKGMEKYFEITGFYPQEFKVNTIQHGFRMQLKSCTKSLKFESKITLLTNVSSLVIPVYIYNGKLDLFMSVPPRPTNKGTLDLGLVTVSSANRASIMLYNPNPVVVCLKSYGTALPGTAFQLLGCLPQLPVSFEHISNVTACNCIQAKWYAVYSILVPAPATAKTVHGELWVVTTHEKLVVPVTLTATSGGRLSQHDLTKFDNCFPGTVCTHLLQIKSSFPIDMDVVSVEAVTPDKRFFFSKESMSSSRTGSEEKTTSRIVAFEQSRIGWLHYDPYLQCDGKCYAALDINSTLGQQWLSGLTLADRLEKDVALLTSRYYVYKNMSATNPCTNISIRIDTTQVRNYLLSVHIPYIWPKLYLGPKTIMAPLSQIDRPSHFQVAIANPSQTRTLLIQLVLDWMLDNNEFWKTLPKELKPPNCPNEEWCANDSSRSFYFDRTNCLNVRSYDNCYSQNEEDCQAAQNIWISNHIDWLPRNILPNADSCIFVLEPNEERNISITFLSHLPRKVSTILYVRNNLTVVEVLRLTGEGVVASLKFGNRKPGSNTPLLFDMTEKHLKDCDKDKNKKITATPNFTVKRTLIARNTGLIPVMVSKFFINGFECEGYGFKVLNCEPFELAPNGTHKVDIAFTPDFTLTKVQRLLILETSLGELVNYTLISSIPSSLAAKCASILKRPYWEGYLLNVACLVLVFMGVGVFVAGVYESNKIWNALSASVLHDPSTVQPPFDLRAIGRMGMSRNDSWDCCSNPIERKENHSPKLTKWNFEENYKTPESRNSQAQKYEEVTTQNNRSKKKVLKKNANVPDTSPPEVHSDRVSLPKESKSTKAESTSNWKSVFARNLGIKNSPKYQSNSSDSSETQKLVNTSQEQANDKQAKLECSKKGSVPLNGLNDGGECSSQHFGNASKKHAKPKSLPVQLLNCEEDTSSTTTDSSNNEDVDKENDVSTSSSSNKSVTSTVCKKTVNSNGKKSKIQCKDNYEGDGEDEEYDHKSQSSHSSTQNESQRRWQKSRETLSNSQVKITSDIVEKHIPENKNGTVNSGDTSTAKPSRRENNKAHTKREKQPVSKKRSLDKNHVFSNNNKTENPQHLTGNFSITRTSSSTPPAIATVWENRASFSDVVSRSENSCNFTTRPKESQEAKKPNSKNSGNSLVTGDQGPQSSANKFTTDESRKPDAGKTSHSDLGPIGSNYYANKKPHSSTWSESSVENQNRPYRAPNQPVANAQEGPKQMNANGSAYFNSHSYFNNFNEAPMKNSPNVANIASNSMGGYGSIGSMNPVQQMHFNIPIASHAKENNIQQSGQSMMYRNMFNSNSDSGLHAYDMNRSMNGNFTELQPDMSNGVSLLNMDKTHMSAIDSFDSYENPWDGVANDEMNFIPLTPNMNASDKVFNAEYSDFYHDNSISWNSQSSLWNSPMNATNVYSNAQAENNSDIQIQPNSSETKAAPSDCGAAEWLWGYNSNGNNAVSDTISNNTRSDSISAHSSHYNNQYQHPTPPIQENAHPFDTYRSLNSIWSTGSSLDIWANQQNYGLNNQDLDNRRQNHFQ